MALSVTAGAAVADAADGSQPLASPRSATIDVNPYGIGGDYGPAFSYRPSGRTTYEFESHGSYQKARRIRLAGRFALVDYVVYDSSDQEQCDKYMCDYVPPVEESVVLRRVDVATGEYDSFDLGKNQGAPQIAVGPTGAVAWVDPVAGTYLVSGAVSEDAPARRVASPASRVWFTGRTLNVRLADNTVKRIPVPAVAAPPPLRPRACAPPVDASIRLNDRGWEVWQLGGTVTVCDRSTGRGRRLSAGGHPGYNDYDGSGSGAHAAGRHLVVHVRGDNPAARLFAFTRGAGGHLLTTNEFSDTERAYAVSRCGDVAYRAFRNALILRSADGRPPRIVKYGPPTDSFDPDVVRFSGRRLLVYGHRVARATGRCR